MGCGNITDGRVQQVNIAEAMDITKTYDYVLLLDVIQYIPPSSLRTVLGNINKLAKKGVILTYAQLNDTSTAIRTNTLDEAGFLTLMQEHLPDFTFHAANTKLLREAAEIQAFQATTTFIVRKS